MPWPNTRLIAVLRFWLRKAPAWARAERSDAVSFPYMNTQPPNSRPAKSGVLYVGTTHGLAIYRAVGRGAWRRAGQAIPGAAVRAIVAADGQTLLVAADGRRPQQSFDGGATWSDAAGSPPEPLG